jgi:hypothetical protein
VVFGGIVRTWKTALLVGFHRFSFDEISIGLFSGLRDTKAQWWSKTAEPAASRQALALQLKVLTRQGCPMNKRLLALITALSVPIAFLSTACGSDKGKDTGTNTDTGSSIGTGTGTGTSSPGTGEGGVTKATEKTWTTAAESACNGETSEPESIPAKIEMVVDVSSSMTNVVGNATKWAQTQDAIVAGFVGDGAAATGLPDSVAVGLLFYPNMQTVEANLKKEKDVSLCVNTGAAIPMVALGVGNQRQKLRDALNGIQLGPRGTPTYDALNYAANTELLDKAANVSGKPYIVIITDGFPTLSQNCYNSTGNIQNVDPEPIVKLIDNLWQEKGIKTFLIGSPGSEDSRDWMSRAAVLGQTAAAGCNPAGPNWCHMDLTTSTDFGAALTSALQAIAGSVVSCNYNILTEGVEGGSVDPNMTVVLARFTDGSVEMVNRDDTPDDCTEGWYVDSGSNQVVFCKETCNKVQSDPGIQLQVLFGCNEKSVTDIQ